MAVLILAKNVIGGCFLWYGDVFFCVFSVAFMEKAINLQAENRIQSITLY